MRNNKTSPFVDKWLYDNRGVISQAFAIALIDQERRFIHANSAFTSLFGFTEREVLGENVNLLKSGLTNKAVYQSLNESIAAAQRWSGVVVNKRKDDSHIWVRLEISPIIKDADKQHYLVMYFDYTAEQQKADYEKEVLRLSYQRDAVSSALHNIGNLQAIKSSSIQQALNGTRDALNAMEKFMPIAMSKPTAEERCDALVLIHDAIKRNLSRIEHSAGVAKSANDDTAALIESYRKMFKQISHKSGNGNQRITSVLELITSIENYFGSRLMRHHVNVCVVDVYTGAISWPESEIKQVAFNLVKNAIDQYKKQGKTGNVWINSFKDDDSGCIVFEVSDAAGGFDVSLEKLFEFGYTTKENGLGLGLHSSANILSTMGGRMEAYNQTITETGAVFRVYLPEVV
jgi:PAS domain S-box-containing protein